MKPTRFDTYCKEEGHCPHCYSTIGCSKISHNLDDGREVIQEGLDGGGRALIALGPQAATFFMATIKLLFCAVGLLPVVFERSHRINFPSCLFVFRKSFTCYDPVLEMDLCILRGLDSFPGADISLPRMILWVVLTNPYRRSVVCCSHRFGLWTTLT